MEQLGSDRGVIGGVSDSDRGASDQVINGIL